MSLKKFAKRKFKEKTGLALTAKEEENLRKRRIRVLRQKATEEKLRAKIRKTRAKNQPKKKSGKGFFSGLEGFGTAKIT